MQEKRNLNSLKMKKKFHTSLIVIILGFSQVANAQINLEHTFSGQVTYQGTYFYNTGLNLFLHTNTTTNQVRLYNEDYSLYKTISITPPSNYNFAGVSLLSKNLFNSDNKLEFIATFFNPNVLSENNHNSYNFCRIINEEGQVIKDFNKSYTLSPSVIKLSNGQWKLSLTRSLYPTPVTYTTEIYSLPGTLPNSISEQGYNPLQPAYPNPAHTIITLPYQLKQGEFSTMNIYNINGQLVETKQLGCDFDKILLNVSNYTKGMYIYEVKGVSNKFIVE